MDDRAEQLGEGAAAQRILPPHDFGLQRLEPGRVSQQIVPGAMRLTAVAEKPDSERSCTTVWNPRPPEARNCAGSVIL